jgi:hypothetical protein
MSTYEDEHGLNRGRNEETPELDNNNAQTTRTRRHLTLQQALDNFLNTPSYSTTDVFTTLNAPGDIPIEPQMLQMLQSMLSSNNGIVTLDEDKKTEGIDDSFLDTLQRVNAKKLKDDDTCPICTNEYKSDSHPLVVELPCNSKHRFDLECIGPWLKLNKTCPLCRVDVTKRKKEIVKYVDSEEEEKGWDMYG